MTCILGRNGVGKTSLLRAIFGLQPIRSGRISLGRPRPRPACRRMSARAPGLALVPQGREIFPRLTVLENLQTGFATSAARPAPHPGRDLHAVPGAEGHAGPARRRPLGRPAAAAGDRPRPGHAAAAVDPRRADRRHPALDHQGYRPGHRAPRRARRHGDPVGRAVFRIRPRPRRRPMSSCSAARWCCPAAATRWTRRRCAAI